MGRSYNQEYDKTMGEALGEGYYICTLVNADYAYIGKLYSDEEFKQTGFAEAIMLKALEGEYLEDHEWAYLPLYDFMPQNDPADTHSIEKVTVLKEGKMLDISKVDPDVAAEAVRRYLATQAGVNLEEAGSALKEKGITLSRKIKFED